MALEPVSDLTGPINDAGARVTLNLAQCFDLNLDQDSFLGGAGDVLKVGPAVGFERHPEILCVAGNLLQVSQQAGGDGLLVLDSFSDPFQVLPLKWKCILS
ncbi:MAG: hypothetical protein ACE5LU_15355 [Anaerolineae bacterium]